MKKILVFCLLFLVKAAISQIVTVPYDSKSFEKVMGSKTMVVLIGDTAYDKPLKRAVEKYWNVTSYQFIEMKNIDTYIADETKTFLLPFVITVNYLNTGTGFSDSKLKAWLTLLLGGGKKLSNYTDGDALAVSAFNYYGDEQDFRNCAYRLDYMVKGMNDALKQTKEKSLSGNRVKVQFAGMEATNEKSVEALTNKTLVVNKDVICWYTKKNVIDEDLFTKAKYPFKVRMVSQKEYKEILKSNDPNVLCLCVAIEVNKHILVYEPATRKTLYYGWQMQGLDLGKKDVKSMAEGKR